MMEIEQLFVYPIKSLRGVSLPRAELTPRGIPYDRRFMLLRDHHDDPNPPKGFRFENMHVSKYAMMCLFTTELIVPEEDHSGKGGRVTVTYRNPADDSRKSLEIPLHPTSADLDGEFDVLMHSSPMRGVRMAQEYSDWFTSCFGFDVVCVFIGANLRPVLGNIAPNAATKNKQRQKAQLKADGTSSSWLTTLSNIVDVFRDGSGGGENGDHTEDDDYKISFADCSSYLVVSSASRDLVSSKLPDGTEMDVTKFRPNIVVSGAAEAWDEDFWGQISIFPSPSSSSSDKGKQTENENESGNKATPARIELTSNCLRCTSLNVDYKTGDFGKDEAGQVLKMLQKDRRVDPGHKYSPAFGRYGFMLHRYRAGVTVSVGDQVHVSKRNQDRTVFKWPGIGQTKPDDLWAL